MSFRVLRWAFEQTLPALQSVVLLRLANHHNQKTGQCFPSIPTLARECGMSVRSVINATKALEAQKLIQVTRRKKNTVNNYTFACDAEQNYPDVHCVHADLHHMPANVHRMHADVYGVHPNRELNKEKNQEENRGEGPTSPAAGLSCHGQAKEIAKEVIKRIKVSNKWVTDQLVQQAEFELEKFPSDLNRICNEMVDAWLDYQQYAMAGKLQNGPISPESFYGNRYWKSKSMWGLKKGTNSHDPFAAMTFING
jgi:DNA-binding transcriptional regulator YhcF (GntR family)